MSTKQIYQQHSISLVVAIFGLVVMISAMLQNNIPKIAMFLYLSLTVVLPFISFMHLISNHLQTRLAGNHPEADRWYDSHNQNRLLSIQLREKELLLKEIHHRIKNNMQIVISLLSTQSLSLENPDAVSALRNSEHRIYAMSLIHQKLYQSENLESIDLSDYIRELSDYLKECLDPICPIVFHYELEKLHAGIERAIPLGLIVNEAVSNSIKHAFTGRQKGEIKIVLRRLDDQHHILTIADNGIGVADDFNHTHNSSMGMTLIQGLAAQLGGCFSLTSDHGLSISIMFKNPLLRTAGAHAA